MPFGTVPASTTARVKVGTASPAATLVGGLQGFEWGESSDTTVDKFYNLFASVTTVSPLIVSVPLSGKYTVADSGQAILRAASAAQTTVFVVISPDGTNGGQVECRVSNWKVTGSGVDGATDWSCQLDQVSDPTTAGTGF